MEHRASIESRNDRFCTTVWPQVAGAGRGEPEALEALCCAYWYPLYAYVRRRGHPHEDSQDLIQAFMGRIIETGFFQRADATKGRLRSFLLSSLKNFLNSQHARNRAEKRGGEKLVVSFDEFGAKERFSLEPADPAAPEFQYDRGWAGELIKKALKRIKDEYSANKNACEFQLLSPYLVAELKQERVVEIAALHGKSEPAIKMALHRARESYYSILREEVAKTVITPDDVDDELKYLIKIIS